MFWSILAIILIWAFIFLREGRKVAFLIAVTLSLIWIIPTELAGWQTIWWVRWIISPLVLGLVWFLSIRWSVLFRFYEIIKKNIANEMDEYFGDVAINVRNSQLETIIHKSIHNYPEAMKRDEAGRPVIKISKEDIVLAVIEDYKHIPQPQKPAYLAAASYCFLYCNNDLPSSIECGLQALEQLDCYNKDHIVMDMYKWFYREKRLAPFLFDDGGNSKFFGNPLYHPQRKL